MAKFSMDTYKIILGNITDNLEAYTTQYSHGLTFIFYFLFHLLLPAKQRRSQWRLQ